MTFLPEVQESPMQHSEQAVLQTYATTEHLKKTIIKNQDWVLFMNKVAMAHNLKPQPQQGVFKSPGININHQER